MPLEIDFELRGVHAQIASELNRVVVLDLQMVLQKVLEAEALAAAAAEEAIAEEVIAQVRLEGNRRLLPFAADSTDSDVSVVLLHVEVLRGDQIEDFLADEAAVVVRLGLLVLAARASNFQLPRRASFSPRLNKC